MPTITRQNALFVSENWTSIYEALENIDFKGYTFDELLQSVMDFIQQTHPDEFTDLIASSEFVMKVEIMAWLFQNLAFRLDLNVRETVLSTAERRESLINIAHMIGYKINRIHAAEGVVKVVGISTSETIIDSNGNNIANTNIIWGDITNNEWYEQFLRIMNSALSTRTRFNAPIRQFNDQAIITKEYLLRSTIPISGSYQLQISSKGRNSNISLFNSKLDTVFGNIIEVVPDVLDNLTIYYKDDGQGFNSVNNGFFFPVKEGKLTSEVFNVPVKGKSFFKHVSSGTNIVEGSVFVQSLDIAGVVVDNWNEISTLYGEGVAFTGQSSATSNIFEVQNQLNDGIAIQFGDGNFSNTPADIMKLWYRTGNPSPISIDPKMVGNQTITMPYKKDGKDYTLTFNLRLVEAMNNGIPSETNESIRRRAGKLFYTQNRMVTGQDYNNYFLKDSRITKNRSVNHGFIGQSRYSKIVDPAGLYENIKRDGGDGRIFLDYDIKTNRIDDDILLTPPIKIVKDVLVKILSKESINYLHNTLYPETMLVNDYKWKTFNNNNNLSNGNIISANGISEKLGSTAIGVFQKFVAPTYIRKNNIRGSMVPVISVNNDGTTDGDVSIININDGDRIYSYKNNMRTIFNSSEESEIINLIKLKQTFAVSWHDTNQKWTIITSTNIDSVNDFSLLHQLDTTGAKLDGSWMIKMEYVQNTNSPYWNVTSRGLNIGFESEAEIDFFFNNINDIVRDPITGSALKDSITILPQNESKYSLRRRGLSQLNPILIENPPFLFTGDGVNKCFKTDWSPLNNLETVVIRNSSLQVYGGDYTFTVHPSGDEICFTNIPAQGEQIIVYYDSRFINNQIGTKTILANNSMRIFDTNTKCVDMDNILVFIDSVLQTPFKDYSTQIGNGGNIAVVFPNALTDGVMVTMMFPYGSFGTLYNRTYNIGDGVKSSYFVSNINLSFDNVIVSLDGVVQDSNDFNLIVTDMGTSIEFTTTPAINEIISFIIMDGSNVCDMPLIRTAQTIHTTTGTSNAFEVTPNFNLATNGDGILVFLDGILQQGPSGMVPSWSVSGSSIVFNTNIIAGLTVHIIAVLGSVGLKYSRNPITALTRTTEANTIIVMGDGNNKVVDLGISGVIPSNIIIWWDSVAQYNNKDWASATLGNGNTGIIFNNPIPNGTVVMIYFYSNTNFHIFDHTLFVTDGINQTYDIPAIITKDDLLLFKDGVLQEPSNYTMIAGSTSTKVTLNLLSTSGRNLDFIYISDSTKTINKMFEIIADGINTDYTLSGITSLPVNGKGIVVTVDGIMQHGPWSNTPSWSVSGNVLKFNTLQGIGRKIQVFVLISVPNESIAVASDIKNNIPNTPLYNTGTVSFIGQDVIMNPVDKMFHADGYTNSKGLVVVPYGANQDGLADDPLLFQDLVIMDNVTDLVLWKQEATNGFTIWSPLGKHTNPAGFYGSNSFNNGIKDNDLVNNAQYNPGDIFYNSDMNYWLVADKVTGRWVKDPLQTHYKKSIGRANLAFKWTHYAPDSHRIDPAKSNIIHSFILTNNFHDAYMNWINRNIDGEIEPVPESSDLLTQTFKSFNQFKMISDSIIFYPVQYKKLFGKRAISQLQATFKVVQNTSSTLNGSDLKIKILKLIDDYFNISRWDIGEGKFYFSELSAYIHANLSTHINTIVIVPKDTTLPFGTMFQIRSEPNELFVSVAEPSDIKLVANLSNNVLNIA